LVPGIWKRTLADLPAAQRKEQEARLAARDAQLSGAVKYARARQLLYIPEMNRWPEERRNGFWHTLRLWTTAHVNNYDDYAAEFLEGPIKPMRQAPDDQ